MQALLKEIDLLELGWRKVAAILALSLATAKQIG